MAGEPQKQESLIGAAWRAVMKDGTIAALGREGIKDIQNAFYDAAFGHSDHSREPGSPLTPLFSDIKEARAQYASPEKSPRPSPSQIAGTAKPTATVHGPAHDADKPHAQTPAEISKGQSPKHDEHGQGKSPTQDALVQREQDRREQPLKGGNDQSEQAKGRSPNEQPQQERDQGRGR